MVGNTSTVRSGLSLIVPLPLAGRHDEEGDGGDVLDVCRPYQAAIVTESEADAVVGDHGDQGPVVCALPVQTVEQPSEQAVRGLDLEQMPLVALLDEKAGLVARAAIQPRQGVLRRCAIEAARGEVLERDVGQERVNEVETRP